MWNAFKALVLKTHSCCIKRRSEHQEIVSYIKTSGGAKIFAASVHKEQVFGKVGLVL